MTAQLFAKFMRFTNHDWIVDTVVSICKIITYNLFTIETFIFTFYLPTIIVGWWAVSSLNT